MKEYNSYRGKGGAKKWLTSLLVLIIAGILAFAALELVIWRGAQGQTAQTGDGPEVMVVFGCHVNKDGPSIQLRERLDAALGYWEEHPDILYIVVSGGKGDNEHISEAQCMYDYLTAHGVDGAKIIREDQSRNTHQNVQETINRLNRAVFSGEPEDWTPPSSFVLVSSDFHLSRILMLWERATGRLDNVTTVPAPVSSVPYRVQMLFREPLALVKSFLFDREFLIWQ